ncbi:hypothetical protein T06_3013 [Trichinella sp. T6]|nr:hypothetical protein T06_3013 [Trichinella sp. T6]
MEIKIEGWLAIQDTLCSIASTLKQTYNKILKYFAKPVYTSVSIRSANCDQWSFYKLDKLTV